MPFTKYDSILTKERLQNEPDFARSMLSILDEAEDFQPAHRLSDEEATELASAYFESILYHLEIKH